MRMLRGAVIGVALLIGASEMLGEGQISRQPQPMPGPGRTSPDLPPIDGRRPGDPDPVSPSIMEQQARTRNNDRQKKLVEDTNKLLSLATDLKQQVDKGSVEKSKEDAAGNAARKAEEIEKLAKSVRERMKG